MHRIYSLKNFFARVPFLIKLQPVTLFKKGLWHRCFPVNFEKILRTSFWQNIFEWLLLLSGSHPPIPLNNYGSTQLLEHICMFPVSSFSHTSDKPLRVPFTEKLVQNVSPVLINQSLAVKLKQKNRSMLKWSLSFQ